MYFKTNKDSETGKKFQQFSDKVKEAQKATFAFLAPFEIKAYNHNGFYIEGGVVKIHTKKQPDPKLWKASKKENEYVPNTRTKAGKELEKALDKLPFVSRLELNMCIGWNERFYSIGFKNGDEFFGFIVSEKFFSNEGHWLPIAIPDDCTEITSIEYKALISKPD